MKVLDITEAPNKKIPVLTKNTIDTLQTSCSEFLNNATMPLFRGFKRDLNGLTKVPIRTNRIPSDSDSSHTAAFNYLFEVYTKIPYIRNSTAFAAMDDSVARSYGEAGFVFPINGTKFYRADGIRDVFSDFEDISPFDEFADEWFWTRNYSDRETEILTDKLRAIDNWIYQRRGKVSVAEVNKRFGKYLKIWKQYLKEFKHILDAFYIYDGFHPELNEANEEIGMFGVPYYYAFPSEKITDTISRYIDDLGFTLYVGDEIIARPTDIDTLIFNAIKYGHEIYALPKKLTT